MQKRIERAKRNTQQNRTTSTSQGPLTAQSQRAVSLARARGREISLNQKDSPDISESPIISESRLTKVPTKLREASSVERFAAARPSLDMDYDSRVDALTNWAKKGPTQVESEAERVKLQRILKREESRLKSRNEKEFQEAMSEYRKGNITAQALGAAEEKASADAQAERLTEFLETRGNVLTRQENIDRTKELLGEEKIRIGALSLSEQLPDFEKIVDNNVIKFQKGSEQVLFEVTDDKDIQFKDRTIALSGRGQTFISGLNYNPAGNHRQGDAPAPGYRAEYNPDGSLKRIFAEPRRYETRYDWYGNARPDRRTSIAYGEYIPHEIIYKNGQPVKEVFRDHYRRSDYRTNDRNSQTNAVYESKVREYNPDGTIKKNKEVRPYVDRDDYRQDSTTVSRSLYTRFEDNFETGQSRAESSPPTRYRDYRDEQRAAETATIGQNTLVDSQGRIWQSDSLDWLNQKASQVGGQVVKKGTSFNDYITSASSVAVVGSAAGILSGPAVSSAVGALSLSAKPSTSFNVFTGKQEPVLQSDTFGSWQQSKPSGIQSPTLLIDAFKSGSFQAPPSQKNMSFSRGAPVITAFSQPSDFIQPSRMSSDFTASIPTERLTTTSPFAGTQIFDASPASWARTPEQQRTTVISKAASLTGDLALGRDELTNLLRAERVTPFQEDLVTSRFDTQKRGKDIDKLDREVTKLSATLQRTRDEDTRAELANRINNLTDRRNEMVPGFNESIGNLGNIESAQLSAVNELQRLQDRKSNFNVLVGMRGLTTEQALAERRSLDRDIKEQERIVRDKVDVFDTMMPETPRGRSGSDILLGSIGLTPERRSAIADSPWVALSAISGGSISRDELKSTSDDFSIPVRRVTASARSQFAINDQGLGSLMETTGKSFEAFQDASLRSERLRLSELDTVAMTQGGFTNLAVAKSGEIGAIGGSALVIGGLAADGFSMVTKGVGAGVRKIDEIQTMADESALGRKVQKGLDMTINQRLNRDLAIGKALIPKDSRLSSFKDSDFSFNIQTGKIGEVRSSLTQGVANYLQYKPSMVALDLGLAAGTSGVGVIAQRKAVTAGAKKALQKSGSIAGLMENIEPVRRAGSKRLATVGYTGDALFVGSVAIDAALAPQGQRVERLGEGIGSLGVFYGASRAATGVFGRLIDTEMGAKKLMVQSLPKAKRDTLIKEIRTIPVSKRTDRAFDVNPAEEASFVFAERTGLLSVRSSKKGLLDDAFVARQKISDSKIADAREREFFGRSLGEVASDLSFIETRGQQFVRPFLRKKTSTVAEMGDFQTILLKDPSTRDVQRAADSIKLKGESAEFVAFEQGIPFKAKISFEEGFGVTRSSFSRRAIGSRERMRTTEITDTKSGLSKVFDQTWSPGQSVVTTPRGPQSTDIFGMTPAQMTTSSSVKGDMVTTVFAKGRGTPAQSYRADLDLFPKQLPAMGFEKNLKFTLSKNEKAMTGVSSSASRVKDSQRDVFRTSAKDTSEVQLLAKIDSPQLIQRDILGGIQKAKIVKPIISTDSSRPFSTFRYKTVDQRDVSGTAEKMRALGSPENQRVLRDILGGQYSLKIKTPKKLVPEEITVRELAIGPKTETLVSVSRGSTRDINLVINPVPKRKGARSAKKIRAAYADDLKTGLKAFKDDFLSFNLPRGPMLSNKKAQSMAMSSTSPRSSTRTDSAFGEVGLPDISVSSPIQSQTSTLGLMTLTSPARSQVQRVASSRLGSTGTSLLSEKVDSFGLSSQRVGLADISKAYDESRSNIRSRARLSTSNLVRDMTGADSTMKSQSITRNLALSRAKIVSTGKVRTGTGTASKGMTNVLSMSTDLSQTRAQDLTSDAVLGKTKTKQKFEPIKQIDLNIRTPRIDIGIPRSPRLRDPIKIKEPKKPKIPKLPEFGFDDEETKKKKKKGSLRTGKRGFGTLDLLKDTADTLRSFM